jgi:hypothetical protein
MLPVANTAGMIEHLRLISQATAKDRQTLVIVDRTGWQNQTSTLFKSVSVGKIFIAFCLKFFMSGFTTLFPTFKNHTPKHIRLSDKQIRLQIIPIL